MKRINCSWIVDYDHLFPFDFLIDFVCNFRQKRKSLQRKPLILAALLRSLPQLCNVPSALFQLSFFPPFSFFSHQIFALCWKNDFKITFLPQGWPLPTQGSKLAFIVSFSDTSSALPMDCSWQSQLLNRITMKILYWTTSPRIRCLCSRRDFWASQVFTVKKSKEVTSQSNLLRDFNLGPFTLCSITIMLFCWTQTC